MSDWLGGENLDTTAGKAVQLFRSAKGMSQGELASALSRRGVPIRQQTVATIEGGTRPLKLSEAVAIAEVLEVELNDLVQQSDTAASLTTINHATHAILEAMGQLDDDVSVLQRARAGGAAVLARAAASGDDQVWALNHALSSLRKAVQSDPAALVWKSLNASIHRALAELDPEDFEAAGLILAEQGKAHGSDT